MTAEIAILNRTAVALAADSIVTLSGTTGSKTYDSAEKIFELSRFRPIGLMVYNNAELIRIPLEILAREFREEISDEFARLTQVWPRFRRFLLGVCAESEFEDSTTQFESLIDTELENLRMTFLNAVMVRAGEDGQQSAEVLERYLEEAIDRVIENADADRMPNFLEDVSLEEFTEQYGAITNRLVERRLVPFVQGLTGRAVDDRLRERFHALAFSLVRSRKRSPAFTGLVFAGFGRDDRFSSLHSVEIDGIYYNQVRVIEDRQVDIDRHGETAAIVPLAQKDMPERFIYGIDQAFEEKLRKIAADLTAQVLEQATDTFDEGEREQIETAAIERFMNSIENQKERAATELRSVVNHLSKKELGEVAYSLVELTSRKRRYSSEMETVGGPIDVAILTRNEGFIWVRRKRYFDVELNPAYMERLNQAMARTGGNDGRRENQGQAEAQAGGGGNEC